MISDRVTTLAIQACRTERQPTTDSHERVEVIHSPTLHSSVHEELENLRSIAFLVGLMDKYRKKKKVVWQCRIWVVHNLSKMCFAGNLNHYHRENAFSVCHTLLRKIMTCISTAHVQIIHM